MNMIYNLLEAAKFLNVSLPVNPKELEIKVFMEREVRSLSGGKAWIKLVPGGFQILHFKNHTFQTEGCTFKFPFKSDLMMRYLDSVKKNVKDYEEAA